MWRWFTGLALLVGLAAVAATALVLGRTPILSTLSNGAEGRVVLRVDRVYPQVGREWLTNLEEPPDGSGRIFVTDRDGRVFILPQEEGDPVVFLDISDRIDTTYWEQGLLGMAFHPDFKENGRLYLHYSTPEPYRSVISRFSANGPDGMADPNSEVVIMEIPQPYDYHNGGQLAFGPNGYLYIALGDGGGHLDPHGNAQDLGSLLGAILRIDVDATPEGESYTVPQDNPFVSYPNARDEIWAYGFRNPWRFAFDTEAGRLWVADVGEDTWEEVNLVGPGLNYGWNIMEGYDCSPPGTVCDSAGLEPPVYVYRTHEAENCAIIGGPVYQGAAFPELAGAYIFGDFCSGRIWGLYYNDYDGEADVTELAVTGLTITAFGQDLQGNLYILTLGDGIYRAQPARGDQEVE